MEKTYVLSFKGNKAELHAQLKAQCALAGKTINGTVLELIENYLKKQDGYSENVPK